MDSNTAEIDTAADKAPPPAWFRFLAPSITDLIFILLLFAMSSGALAPRLLGDASIGWHIRNGEQMLHVHSVTRTDPFSVTMGHTWYAWEWLYDVAIADIHHSFGLNGVVFVTGVIIALTFAITLRLCLRRGADLPVTALLLALSLGVSMIHLFARPHVLSWLFTVIWFRCWMDHRARTGCKPPALMVPARADAVLGERAWRLCAGPCAARLVSVEMLLYGTTGAAMEKSHGAWRSG